jgi:hypothetical protein
MIPFFKSRQKLIRAIAIQLGIAGVLTVWFLVAWPQLKKEWAEGETARKEQKILSLVRSVVAEDPARDAPNGSLPGFAHPQRLVSTPTESDVKAALGPTDGFSGDFRGGVHMTWIGTDHIVEASFDKQRLYCLKLENRHTGHGEMVFESSLEWRTF